MMNKLNIKMKEVETKEDFLELMKLLMDELKQNDWENSTLEKYLWGIEGWVDDIEGYFENFKDDESLEKLKNNTLDWKILAHMLVCATVYE